MPHKRIFWLQCLTALFNLWNNFSCKLAGRRQIYPSLSCRSLWNIWSRLCKIRQILILMRSISRILSWLRIFQLFLLPRRRIRLFLLLKWTIYSNNTKVQRKCFLLNKVIMNQEISMWLNKFFRPLKSSYKQLEMSMIPCFDHNYQSKTKVVRNFNLLSNHFHKKIY